MTRLDINYVSTLDHTDEQEFMSDEEAAQEQHDMRGSKDFNPALHPRDAEGQFAEVPDERLMVSAGPMAGVKMTLGTMREEDQQTIRETLDRLGAKYPSVVPLIKSVAGAPLKTRWGSLNNQGKMKFTNYGKKYDDYIDPLMENTVAHEFGHAVIHNMAGVSKADEAPPRMDAPMIRAYNHHVREERAAINETVTDIYKQIRAHFDTSDGNKILEQIYAEFPENPHYAASDPEELLCYGFSHHETGQDGPIADIVGRVVDEYYWEAS